MKKSVSVIIVLFLFVCCLPLGITGCSGPKKDSNGLLYYTVDDFIETSVKNEENESKKKSREEYLKKILDNNEGYVCVVSKIKSPDLVIPDEFKGVPVTALTSSETEPKDITSIKIGINVKTIFEFRDQGNNANVKEIMIPRTVTYCSHSFYYLKGATVKIAGSIAGSSNSFLYCESVKIVLTEPKAFKYVADRNFKTTDSDSLIVGTEKLFKFNDSINEKDILSRGTNHFQEKLDPGKQIDPENAKNYAKYLDGPVVTMENSVTNRENVYYGYNKDTLIRDSKPVLINVVQVANTLPTSFYQPQSDSPKVYFIVEKTGGVNANYKDADISFIMYRISVRDYNTDELICWFKVTPGYAPLVINDLNKNTFVDGGYRFLLEWESKQAGPLHTLHQYFS